MSGNALELPPSLQPGEPAPDFTLAAIHRDGTLALADYRGRSPLLLALFRGLYCPFCRAVPVDRGQREGRRRLPRLQGWQQFEGVCRHLSS